MLLLVLYIYNGNFWPGNKQYLVVVQCWIVYLQIGRCEIVSVAAVSSLGGQRENNKEGHLKMTSLHRTGLNQQVLTVLTLVEPQKQRGVGEG